jgi:hypothetical protein
MSDMAGYQALAAVGRSVVALLNRRIDEELAPARRPLAVLAGAQDFEQVNNEPEPVISFPALSVYCCRLSVDRETRPGWSAATSFDGIPHLTLRMHLLLMAWDRFVENELEWLGLAMRILDSEPILSGPLLDPSGGWEPGDAIQIIADDIALEDLSEAFEALTTKFRLSMPYVARVIRIDGLREAGAGDVATVGLASEQMPATL